MQNLHLQSERCTPEILPTLKWPQWGRHGTGVPVLTHAGSINIYSIFKMIRGRGLCVTVCHLLPFPGLQHVKLQLSCTCRLPSTRSGLWTVGKARSEKHTKILI